MSSNIPKKQNNDLDDEFGELLIAHSFSTDSSSKSANRLENFALDLRKFRTDAGLTRRELAEKTMLTEAKLLALEHAVVPINCIKSVWLADLARTLNVSLEKLTFCLQTIDESDETLSEEELVEFEQVLGNVLTGGKSLVPLPDALDISRISQEITTRPDLPAILSASVQGAQDLFNGDIITLYPYHHLYETFDASPITLGLKCSELPLTLNDEESIPSILRLSDIYSAEDAQQIAPFQEILGQSEEVVSALGLPLIARKHKVGILVIGYRATHKFSDEEQVLIKDFANQIAISIYSAQLEGLNQRQSEFNVKLETLNQKQSGFLHALNEACHTITNTLTPQMTLAEIVKQAVYIFNTQNKRVNFGSIGITKGGDHQILAAYPQEKLPEIQEKYNEEVKTLRFFNKSRFGITGRATATGESQFVADAPSDIDYIMVDATTQSELAIPLRINDGVTGVFNLEIAEQSTFDRTDQKIFESLANLAVVAVRDLLEYNKSQVEQDIVTIPMADILAEFDDGEEQTDQAGELGEAHIMINRNRRSVNLAIPPKIQEVLEGIAAEYGMNVQSVIYRLVKMGLEIEAKRRGNGGHPVSFIATTPFTLEAVSSSNASTPNIEDLRYP